MPGEVLTLTQKEAHPWTIGAVGDRPDGTSVRSRCRERDGYLTGAHVELTPWPPASSCRQQL